MSNSQDSKTDRADRRDSFRLALHEGELTTRLTTDRAEFTTLDISASGAALLLQGNRIESLRHHALLVEPSGFRSFVARVEPIAVKEPDLIGMTKIGVRFDGLSRLALESLSQFIAERYARQNRSAYRQGVTSERDLSIREQRAIKDTLWMYTRNDDAVIKVYDANQTVPGQFCAKALTEIDGVSCLVIEPMSSAMNTLERGKTYSFSFPGPNVVYWFDAAVRDVTTDRSYRIEFPSVILKTGFRSSLRTSPQESLRLSFLHPRLKGYCIHKEVLDVSSGGVSFAFDPTTDLLFPGERLVIELGDGAIWAEAIVRNLSYRRGGVGMMCGLELIRFPQQSHAEAWKRLVVVKTYPTLELGGQQTVAEAWKVLESSKYVGGETTNDIEDHLREQYQRSWSRYAVNSRFGRFFVAYHQQTPVGTAAATLLYPQTWMLHHFGIDERRRNESKRFLFDVARSIYSAMFQLLQQLDDFTYFVLYVDAGKSWNRMMYNQFLETYPIKADFVFDEFVLYKASPSAIDVSRPSSSVGFDIRTHDPALLCALAAHFRETRSPIEVDSFCLDAERISLRDFSEQCTVRGYRRERRVFFAVKNGTLLAAVIAELGEEGANIFNLINRCWYIAVAEGTIHNSEMKEQLLRRAINYYARRGAKETLYFGPKTGEDETVLERVGFRREAEALRFIGHRNLLPSWMNYVEELLRALALKAS